MSRYLIALFLHVSGAIGVWITLGVWLFGLAALRRARRVEQARALAWLVIIATPLMLLSLAVLGIAGFYMALTVWGLQTSWIAVSLFSLLVIAPIGAFVLDPRMRAILSQAQDAHEGALPDALAARIRDPLLAAGAQSMASVLLGVIFLMTTKPPLDLAMLVMVAAFALGLISALPVIWGARRHADALAKQKSGSDPFQRKTIWTRRW